MRQEDYNDMMRSPGERIFNKIMSHAPRCPRCGNRYLGDGKTLCTECAADYIDPTPEAEDDVDCVRCLACGWAGDVTAGAEDCPQCQAYGELQWADDGQLSPEKSKGEGTLGPSWFDEYEYRIKPTKPSIDWSHVGKRIKAIATDSDGRSGCHTMPPTSRTDTQWHRGAYVCAAEVFASFKPGTCDWRDSLIVRPGYEENES